jgi:metal-responsive CopG/Arc/MetJ family transcriptional regulator
MFLMPKERIRTTIDIPIELLERINTVLGKKVAPSRNALFIQALQRYLEDLEQEEIDVHIAQMAEDATYQELHIRMVKEYEPAGWEALRLSEESS